MLRAISAYGTPAGEKVWTYARSNVAIYSNGVMIDWKRTVTVTLPEGGTGRAHLQLAGDRDRNEMVLAFGNPAEAGGADRVELDLH